MEQTAAVRIMSKDITEGCGMSPSEAIVRYRAYAADCVETAQASGSDRKFAFLLMAMAWLGLANQVEKTSAPATPSLTPGSQETGTSAPSAEATALDQAWDLTPGVAS